LPKPARHFSIARRSQAPNGRSDAAVAVVALDGLPVHEGSSEMIAGADRVQI
jgi:hypothetical protein